jgi:hypothetical protein
LNASTSLEIKRHDLRDRMKHKPEHRLFGQILFSSDPAKEAKVLNEIPRKALSPYGRRCRKSLAKLKREGKLDSINVQSVFVGRNLPEQHRRWFYAVMDASHSTVNEPFEKEELTR